MDSAEDEFLKDVLSRPEPDFSGMVCDFCHRDGSDRPERVVVAGPDCLVICDECIELCSDIVAEKRKKKELD